MEYRTDVEGVQEAWREFLTTRDPAAREELLTAYYPLVRKVAGKIRRRMESQEFDDLVSYGVPGLIRALDLWDPARYAAKFETYAISAIRGMILDELRSQDWAPRSLRRRHREVEAARARAEAALGREATSSEIAAEAGLTAEEVAERYAEADMAMVRELDFRTGGEEGEETVRRESVEDARPSPESTASVRRAMGAALATIRELNWEERAVMSIHYYEGRTLGDAARELDITESRASQLHSRAVMAVREAMDAALVAEDPVPRGPNLRERVKRAAARGDYVLARRLMGESG